jgi:hypothetical protein
MANYKDELASLSYSAQNFSAPVQSPEIAVEAPLRPISSFSFFTKQNLYKYGIYVVIPIVLIIVLYAMKPSFVKMQIENEEGEEVEVVSIKKIILWGIVITIPLATSFYIFNKKKKLW